MSRNRSVPQKCRWQRLWALVAILLLAFVLRMVRLGSESLWYDETVSVHLAGKALPDLVAHTAGDIHPPGYYVLLHAWTRLAGASDFATAFPSVFWGLLLVALAYWLGTRVYGPRAGLLAALLVAISPYNIWYSQEVRMYTLGAVLGLGLLGTVISMLAAPSGKLPTGRSLAGYAVLGALGLWALTYFAFLLVAVNLMVGVWWLVSWRRAAGGQTEGRARWAWLGRWALAQGGVLLLYAPWLPIAWRQATNPPVPPWRSITGLGDVVLQTWSALSLGQSVEPARVWPILLLFVVLFGLGLFYKQQRRGAQGDLAPEDDGAPGGRAEDRMDVALPWLLAGYVFLPVLLIYLASFVTPLYHVRYAFTYSTPFYVLAGAGLARLGQRWRPALWLALAAILVFSGLSVYAYHTDPRYASDDHRAATRFLSQQWRPGDAILVNAGYAYTALVTYWDGADPIAWRGRLAGDWPADARGPLILQTGTVDGDPSLGWGDPASDFYALSWAETEEALTRLFQEYHRVWVYRIYDTVTDPDGRIRAWLDEHGIPFEDQTFTGESQLRVQGFLTERDPLAMAGRPLDEGLADGSLRLVAAEDWPQRVMVGSGLDLALVWQVGSAPADDAILFAGLFDGEGRRWAQTDERPLGSLYTPGDWPEGGAIRSPLRVWVPADTPPGRYRLEVGWYRFVEGQPVWLPWTSGERVLLGEVEVAGAGDWSALPVPEVAHPIGTTIGDGVQLLGFEAAVLEGQPGDTLELDLLWRALVDVPGPGPAVLQLLDEEGNVVAEYASPPVGGQVPFTSLESGQVLRDRRSFTLPAGVAPGVYTLSVGRRGPDGAWLPVRRGLVRLGAVQPLATVRIPGRKANLIPPDVPKALEATFGEGIRFVGYGLEVSPSQVELALHWQALGTDSGQALATLPSRYKIFVHLVGAGTPSDIRAQADVYPRLPTAAWLPGEYLSDHVAVNLPADLPPGEYTLLLGLYDEATGVRLPVTDGNGGPAGDSLPLETLRLGD